MKTHTEVVAEADKAARKERRRVIVKILTPPRKRKPARKRPAPRALKPLVQYVLRTADIEDAATIRLVEAYCGVIIGSAVTFAQKQKDYGPGNIAGGGSLGIVIRMRDKVERLLNLQGKPATNESKSDSAGDLHVYGAILYMAMKGMWPGLTTDPRLNI